MRKTRKHSSIAHTHVHRHWKWKKKTNIVLEESKNNENYSLNDYFTWDQILF